MLLPDGTVIPSYLQVEHTLDPEPSGMFGNIMLRIGEVREVVYPNNPNSLSKKVVEYRVAVQQRDVGVGVTTEYSHCVVGSLFGGVADKLRYTVRPSTGQNVDQDTDLGNGSMVLLLCVNGETDNAIIIGGFPAPRDVPEADEGHHLHFNFNGIDVAINKNGEFALTFGGATKNDGTLVDGADAGASGTNVAIAKDGSLSITDASGKQFFKIDHTNKTIALTADGEYDVTCTNGNVVIKSEGVLVGDATDAWVKGTSYRRAESQMNKQVSAALQGISIAATQLGALLAAAGSLMSMGPAGNIPAAGPVTTAATAAIQIATQAATAKAAIDVFEAGADSYLSDKNLTD